jgi:hypothetical protein
MQTRINGTYRTLPPAAAINSAGITDFGCINKGTRISEDKCIPGSSRS